MRRTSATTCGAALATLVLLAVTAPSATADPHQVVEESPEPTVWCTGVTTDDSLIEFDLVTNAEGQVVRSSLEIIEAGWGGHLAKGVPLDTTFTDGKIDAGFELRDPSGDAVGTARFVGTYTVGETVTTKDRWSVGNTQWHFVGSSTPYSLTWSSVEIGHWQVENLDCIAGAGESTTSFTAPHRGVASGAYWDLAPGCLTEEIRSLDVVTTENETFLLVDTPDGQAVAAVSGDGVQTGAVDWYDPEGEPLGTGSASATWQQLSPRKTGTASPTQTSNRVTHTTAYQLGFDLERVDGGHLGNTCGVDFVEWRQIGDIEE